MAGTLAQDYDPQWGSHKSRRPDKIEARTLERASCENQIVVSGVEQIVGED
jgi:hypothetical protein